MLFLGGIDDLREVLYWLGNIIKISLELNAIQFDSIVSHKLDAKYELIYNFWTNLAQVLVL